MDFGGYTCKPNEAFPQRPPNTKWVYTIDLHAKTFRVSLEGYANRIFRLDNPPRSLFESTTAAPRESSVRKDIQVFIDPVARAHLPSFDHSASADPALLAFYQTCASKLCEIPPFPDVDSLSVQIQLRLVLLTEFYNEHKSGFHCVNHSRSSFVASVFPRLVHDIIDLTRSSVEVRFMQRRVQTALIHPRHTPVAESESDGWPDALNEYWIDGVLLILELDISTMENLHAAIGRAIQLINTRPTTVNLSTEFTTPIPSAVICSLTSIVLVYINGEEITHTGNLELFPQHSPCLTETVASDGILALIQTFFRPSQLSAPRVFPARHNQLPTEIMQLIFSFAAPATRSALVASCRLFRAISLYHGVRIGDCYLQRRSPEHGSSAFVGECYALKGYWLSPRGTQTRGTYRVFGRYTTHTVINFAPRERWKDQGYFTILIQPDWGIVKLERQLCEAKELS